MPLSPEELRKRRRDRDSRRAVRANWQRTGGLVKIEVPDTSFDPFRHGILLGLSITGAILALVYAIAG